MFQKRTPEGYLTEYGTVYLPLGMALFGAIAFGVAGHALSEVFELNTEGTIELTVLFALFGGLTYYAQGVKEGMSV